MSEELTALSKTIRFDNASKGFDPTEGGIDRYLLLTISEICEAQEELRDGREPKDIYYEEKFITVQNSESDFEHTGVIARKPCGFSVEIADAIIRLLDIHGKFDRRVELFVGYIDFSTGTIDSALLQAAKHIADAYNGYFAGHFRVDFWTHLATALSRLFAICNSLNIDIMPIIHEKLAFNRSRPPKHGRKF